MSSSERPSEMVVDHVHESKSEPEPKAQPKDHGVKPQPNSPLSLRIDDSGAHAIHPAAALAAPDTPGAIVVQYCVRVDLAQRPHLEPTSPHQFSPPTWKGLKRAAILLLIVSMLLLSKPWLLSPPPVKPEIETIPIHEMSIGFARRAFYIPVSLVYTKDPHKNATFGSVDLYDPGFGPARRAALDLVNGLAQIISAHAMNKIWWIAREGTWNTKIGVNNMINLTETDVDNLIKRISKHQHSAED
ncbi:hypothetical protein FPHYL_4632 [Fusarium phyllophilum]|uniref:Uncharacterized protein n=1 Tax=Fusarium phyllophilum TaxID=47803 RepID=A0A8H5NHR4_9HYPO|nr:hypothetical protein FPHYL_4632 [Fusarium phyllophilum]